MNKKDKIVVKRIQKTQKLLSKFGLKAYAFDPGVACYVIEEINGRKPYSNSNIEFNGATWKWLEPLLKELVKLRKGKVESGKKKRSKQIDTDGIKG